MAGKKGMHTRASTSPVYAEALRARIEAPRIVTALMNHIDGKRDMTSTQVQAATVLLRKVMPDLAQSDSTVTVRRDAKEFSRDELAAIAGTGSARADPAAGRREQPDRVH